MTDEKGRGLDIASLRRHQSAGLQFNTHFKGVFLLTQALLPLINDGCRIVTISSGLARVSMNGRVIYGPTKAAVETLSRYMAQEPGPRRIGVNVVAPGAIATDFFGRRGARQSRGQPDGCRPYRDWTRRRRTRCRPAIAGLRSDDFGWINAQRVEVAGGMQI